VTVADITTATGVTAGGNHACARLDGGSAKCWGYNDAGQLGDGTNTATSTPVTVLGL
jgi:alpha-tubulin suppressor-like RCC1 family protein